jgi:hypothetical protein
MYDFIVGGFVPGTNYQISFRVWLLASVVSLILIYAFYRLLKVVFAKTKQMLFINITMLPIVYRPMATATAHKAEALQVNIASAYSRWTGQAQQALKSILPND